jgi:hypothetical protein
MSATGHPPRVPPEHDQKDAGSLLVGLGAGLPFHWHLVYIPPPCDQNENSAEVKSCSVKNYECFRKQVRLEAFSSAVLRDVKVVTLPSDPANPVSSSWDLHLDVYLEVAGSAQING